MHREDYALLMYGSEADGETPSQMSTETADAWAAFWGELAAAGVDGTPVPLLPSRSARTVRRRGGRVITDGPFAETKEQLGGVIVLRDIDRATALSWAVRMPCASQGSVEVRPLLR